MRVVLRNIRLWFATICLPLKYRVRQRRNRLTWNPSIDSRPAVDSCRVAGNRTDDVGVEHVAIAVLTITLRAYLSGTPTAYAVDDRALSFRPVQAYFRVFTVTWPTTVIVFCLLRTVPIPKHVRGQDDPTRTLPRP